MRVIILSLFIAGLSLSVFAREDEVAHDERYWNQRYREVCGESTSNQFCERLKNSNGTWVQPKKSLIEVLRLSSDSINEVAQKFDINPRMIVAPILVENSLNVQVDDEIQNFLVGAGVLSDGEIMGRRFSIGLGQINMSAALEVEPLVAQIEGRPERTQEEVAQALLTPEGAFTYSAGIARKVIDVYKEKGIDISDKPGVVATLYNIGRYEERAQRTVSEGREPGVNYFGLFAEKNMDTIDKIIKGESAEVRDDSPGWWESTQNFFGYGGREIYLRSRPDECSTTGRGNSGLYNRAETLIRHDVVAISNDINEYAVIGEGYGCDAQKWILVRDEDGAVGWVEDGTFKNLPESEISIGFFESRSLNSCADQLKRKYPKQFISAKEGEVVFKFLSANESGQVDWKRNNVNEYECGQEANTQVSPSNFNMQFSSFSNYTPPPAGSREKNLAELRRRLTVIKNFKEKVLRDLNLDSWNSGANPYKLALGEEGNAQVYARLDGMFNRGIGYPGQSSQEDMKYYNAYLLDKVSKCLDGGRYCDAPGIDGLPFDESVFKVKNNPTYSEMVTIGYQMGFLGSVSYKEPANSKWDVELKEEASEKIKICIDVFSKLPQFIQTNRFLVQLLDAIKRIPEGSSLTPMGMMMGMYNSGGNSQNSRAMLIQSFDKIAKQCQDLDIIMFAQDNTNANPACQTQVSESDIINGVSLNSDILRNMVTQDPTQFDQYFMNLMNMDQNINTIIYSNYRSPVQNTVTNSNSSEPEPVAVDPLKCSYDPFKNAEMIKEMLNISCVKRAMVPDAWQVKNASDEEKDVIYREFRESDRFIIDVR